MDDKCRYEAVCPKAFFFGCVGLENCAEGKLIKTKTRNTGGCPECGSTDIERGVYAGGGPDGCWLEDACRKCGKHFNSRTKCFE